MALFHPDHDELHGFTVCIATTGPMTYIGRWDHEEGGKILLNDASIHHDGDGGKDKEAFIKDAALWGVKVNAPHCVVERSTVKSIEKLGDIAGRIRGW